MNRIFLVSALIVLVALGSRQPELVAAQSPVTIPTPATSEIPAEASTLQAQLDEVLEASEAEGDVLQAQLEEMRAANEKLLMVVQWTLGIVVTAFVVLLGYNIFQQRWADDRTRKNITEDIRTELRQYVEGERDSLRSELSTELLASMGQALEPMSTELKSLSDTSEEQVASLKRDYQVMNLSRLEENVRQSIQRGPFVSLHEALRLLELSLELETEGLIQDPHVVGALESLRAILPRAFMITERDINDIGATLDKVPDKYKASRESIRAEAKVRGPEPPPPPTLPQSRTLDAPATSPPRT